MKRIALALLLSASPALAWGPHQDLRGWYRYERSPRWHQQQRNVPVYNGGADFGYTGPPPGYIHAGNEHVWDDQPPMDRAPLDDSWATRLCRSRGDCE